MTFSRIRINRFASLNNKQSPIRLIQHVNTFPHHIFWSPRWDTPCVDVDDEGDALVSSIMSETIFTTSFATSALRRCPPQFQVISLIMIFLSVLLSTIYVIYLILYAPLERIALIALAFLVWQNQRSPSIHQPPTAPLAPESFISLNDQYQPALPAYTLKSTISTNSDDSESSNDSDVSLQSRHRLLVLSMFRLRHQWNQSFLHFPQSNRLAVPAQPRKPSSFMRKRS